MTTRPLTAAKKQIAGMGSSIRAMPGRIEVLCRNLDDCLSCDLTDEEMLETLDQVDLFLTEFQDIVSGYLPKLATYRDELESRVHRGIEQRTSDVKQRTLCAMSDDIPAERTYSRGYKRTMTRFNEGAEKPLR